MLRTVLVVSYLALLFQVHAHADVVSPHSVVANGGGDSENSVHRLRGTVGQPCIGTMEGVSHQHQVGFWFPAVWAITGVADTSPGALPTKYWMGQNYPNPFNPRTTISFSLEKRGHVQLRIYDVAGRSVRTLVDEVQDAGILHSISWDGDSDGGSRVASGVYFYELRTSGFRRARKLVVLE